MSLLAAQAPAAALLTVALAARAPDLAALPLLAHRLPAEILAEIHHSLLASLTASLAASAAAALTDYQRRLKAGLCRDCREYNEHIYGPDVWAWEGYKGACLCRAQQAVFRARRPSLFTALLAKLCGKSQTPAPASSRIISQEDVPVFASKEAWLADYFSRHELCRDFSSVWDTVDLALAPYDCRVSRTDLQKTATIVHQNTDEWQAKCALKCVVNDLMLSQSITINEPAHPLAPTKPTPPPIPSRKFQSQQPPTVFIGSRAVSGGLHASTLIPISHLIVCGRRLLLFLLLIILLSLLLSVGLCA